MSCECRAFRSEYHSCPFQEDVNGNHDENYCNCCNCCSDCQYECAMDI